MRYFFSIIVFLSVFISCSQHTNDSEYDKFISGLEKIAIKDSIRIHFDDSPVNEPIELTIYRKEQPIVVDASNWTLHLMDEKGNFVNHTGGVGRGPNEYQLINQIHMSANNQLYVYDARSKDITVYSILNNKFQLEKEIAIPTYDNAIFLKDIYKTDSGFIGVFQRLTGHNSKENAFEVYRLGEDLQLQAHLFKMPGNETYTTGGAKKTKPLGDKTLWGMAGGKFYYTTTNNLSVTSYSIQSDSLRHYDLSDIPKPIKGEEEINAIENRLRFVIQTDPKIKKLISKGQYLPYTIDFLPTQDYFYYTLFRPGKAHGLLLRLDKATNELKKIRVPPYFNLYAAHNNMLFGIDHTVPGANEVLILKVGS